MLIKDINYFLEGIFFSPDHEFARRKSLLKFSFFSPAQNFSHSHTKKNPKKPKNNNYNKNPIKNKYIFKSPLFFFSSLKTFPSISSVSSLATLVISLFRGTLTLIVHLSSFENIHLWCLIKSTIQPIFYTIAFLLERKSFPVQFHILYPGHKPCNFE